MHGHIFAWMNGDDYYINESNKTYTHFVPAVFVPFSVTYMYYINSQLEKKRKQFACLALIIEKSRVECYSKRNTNILFGKS